MKRFKVIIKKLAVVSPGVGTFLSLIFLQKILTELLPHLIKASPGGAGNIS